VDDCNLVTVGLSLLFAIVVRVADVVAFSEEIWAGRDGDEVVRVGDEVLLFDTNVFIYSVLPSLIFALLLLAGGSVLYPRGSTCVVFDEGAEGVRKPLFVVPVPSDVDGATVSCSFNVSKLNAAADSAACSCC